MTAIKIPLALAALAIIATTAVPVARADESDFLADMEASGFVNNFGKSSEVAIGYQICAEIAAGASPLAAARDLWLKSQLDAYSAGRFVGIAVRDLCPAYAPIGKLT